MTDRLEGVRVAITGSASGMGKAFALGFAREGARVAVLDRDVEGARAVADAIADAGGTAVGLGVDVTVRGEVAAALDEVVSRWGGLDVMFNLAGLNVPMHLLDVTEENWRTIMDVNALGTLICIQEAARRMIPAGAGKIVNTSSIAGRQGYPSFAPYSASKFAVNALTQAAARGLAEHNITCNAFAPGVVATPLWERLDEDLVAIGDAERPGEAMAAFSADILRGRPAQPEDLLGTALFLASSDSDYLTGQVLMADGGMVLV